jgi:hypothetical protein
MIPEPRSGPVRPDSPGYFSRGKVAGESRAVSARGRAPERPAKLRFITYLSPGIPREFFEALVDYVRWAVGTPKALW